MYPDEYTTTRVQTNTDQSEATVRQKAWFTVGKEEEKEGGIEDRIERGGKRVQKG